MANPEHLEILKLGVEKWNQWRRENPDIMPDLSNAYLAFANMVRADLRDVNLSKAYLFRASLNFADLGGADLSGAILKEADLSGADLSRAHMGYTQLIATEPVFNVLLLGSLPIIDDHTKLPPEIENQRKRISS